MQRIAGIIVAVIALAIAGYAYLQSNVEATSERVAIAQGKPTENGLFLIRVEPENRPIEVGPIHTWLVGVNDPQGAPVEGAKVVFDGGMPAHGHGLPTVPEQTIEVQPGIYRIDGVKFSMLGAWELRINVEAGGQSDSTIFDLEIE